jgi:hypothetical protein
MAAGRASECLESERRVTTADGTYPHRASERASWVTVREVLSHLRTPMVAKTALIVCFGAYFAGTTAAWTRVAGAVLVASALWFFLYALNEVWDLVVEKGRPASKLWTIGLGAALAAIILVSLSISPALALLLLLTTLSQAAYSLPPIRAKRYWWMVLLLSGVLNPVLRLQCGAVLGAHALPALAYAAAVLLHVGGAIRTRLLRRARDAGLGYRTVPEYMRFVGMAASGGGLVCVALLCVAGVLPVAFYPLTAAAAIFTGYVWSGRVDDIHPLRKAWLLCAPLALAVPLLLWKW